MCLSFQFRTILCLPLWIVHHHQSCMFVCLQSLGTKVTLHLLPTLQNYEPVPQVLKQFVNLSCLYWYYVFWYIFYLLHLISLKYNSTIFNFFLHSSVGGLLTLLVINFSFYSQHHRWLNPFCVRYFFWPSSLFILWVSSLFNPGGSYSGRETGVHFILSPFHSVKFTWVENCLWLTDGWKERKRFKKWRRRDSNHGPSDRVREK